MKGSKASFAVLALGYVFLPIAALSSAVAHAAEKSINCVVSDLSDGEKTEWSVSWNDEDSSKIMVDGGKVPAKGAKFERTLEQFGPTIIAWCAISTGGRSTTRMCYTVDRSRGDIEQRYANFEGKVKVVGRGLCRVSTEATKF